MVLLGILFTMLVFGIFALIFAFQMLRLLACALMTMVLLAFIGA